MTARRGTRVMAGAAGVVLVMAGLMGVSVGVASADTSQPAFVITPQSRTNVTHFETFRYDTARAVNVPEAAAARINAAVSAIVMRNVREALRSNHFGCQGGSKKCGVLDAWLTQLPCVGGYLCVQQLADEYWPGAATSNKAVDALVFDPTSGAAVPITSEVAPTQQRAFVASVRAAVKAFQIENDFYDPVFMKLVTLSAMKHWAPLADGIHIWFDKYVAGPGVAGIVEVTVPYPTTALIKP